MEEQLELFKKTSGCIKPDEASESAVVKTWKDWFKARNIKHV